MARTNTPRSRRRIAATWTLLVPLGVIVLLTASHFPYATDPEVISPQTVATVETAYERTWDRPAPPVDPSDIDYRRIVDFVKTYNLQHARVLEIGAGMGKLQDIVEDYTGLDISPSSRPHFHKPFIQASATAVPLPDDSFDAIWSINVLEHVAYPEHALREMRRLLRHGGYLYLSPAWQCRPWAAEGYQVRPWSEFGFRGKLIKASIPLRDSVAFRLIYTMPLRAIRFPAQFLGETRFRYRLLSPNYQTWWQPDSDALNSMDPYEAIIWFTSRGDRCLNYPTHFRQLTVRTGPLILQINKARP